MKTMVKIWFALFIASVVFYYGPVYFFSNNLEQSVKSLTLKDVVPLVVSSQMDIYEQRSDDAPEKIKAITERAVSDPHFDADVSIWDALKNNPSVKNVEIVLGSNPSTIPSYSDPMYGNRDVGLKATFSDNGGLMLIFNAVDKGGLFSGHGAKVLRLVDGFRYTANGKELAIGDEDALGKLALTAFAREPKTLLGVYNTLFKDNMPIVDVNSDTKDAAAKQNANALASNPEYAASTTNIPSPTQAAPQPQTTAPVSTTSLTSDQVPPENAVSDSCANRWMVAYRKEQGQDALVSADQLDEWQQWCTQGKQAP